MPDRLRQLADTVRNGVHPPDFDLLARESRRRHRRAVIASGVAVSTVVLGIAFGVRAASDDAGGPLPPVDGTSTPAEPTPTRSTTTSPELSLTADEVVDDPASFLSSLAVSPTDPDVAAAVWWHCARKSCDTGVQAAIALTSDNWRTRSTRLLESFPEPTRSHLVVNALSDGRLLVHRATTYGTPVRPEPRLLGPDLTLTPLAEHPAGSGGPQADEAIPTTVFGGAGAWAIDAGSRSFRDLGSGRGWRSAALTPNGIVVANTGENRVGYSTDSGASWRFVPEDAASRIDGRWAVGSAQPGTIAVLEGNAGCEAGCSDTLDLSRDAGATWSTVDLGGYIGHWAVITSHGTLLYVAGRPPALHVQVLRATADDLGNLHVVLDGAETGRIDRLGLSESNGTETVTACGDDGSCARSVDDGRTWSRFAMR
jgi:hypothetical protein